STLVTNVGASVVGTYGSIAIASNGAYTYTLDNSRADIQALAIGEHPPTPEVFTYTVNDGHGGTSTALVTITITGTNDAPLVAATDVTGAVTESLTPVGNLSDSGTITFTDVDLTDAHSISVTATSTTPLGTLTPSISTDSTGTGLGGVISWNYSVAASAVEYLAAGQTKLETFTITLNDGHGSTVDRTVSVTITGTNDQPVVDVADVNGAVTETTGTPVALAILTDNGMIAFTDVDLIDIHSVSAVTPTGTPLGSLTATLTTGTSDTTGLGGVVTWNYSVDAALVEYLQAGQTKLETFSFNVLDNKGGSVTRTVEVTITGTNDQPVVDAGDVTGAVSETTGTPVALAILTDNGT
ncbi:MAG: VCBS domain-containing protein, partial [Gallionella sp.]|nr:VCBS domain-containing protein [Gallionella sp.]